MKKIKLNIEYDLETGALSYLGTTNRNDIKELSKNIGSTERKFISKKIALFYKAYIDALNGKA